MLLVFFTSSPRDLLFQTSRHYFSPHLNQYWNSFQHCGPVQLTDVDSSVRSVKCSVSQKMCLVQADFQVQQFFLGGRGGGGRV